MFILIYYFVHDQTKVIYMFTTLDRRTVPVSVDFIRWNRQPGRSHCGTEYTATIRDVSLMRYERRKHSTLVIFPQSTLILSWAMAKMYV